MIKELLKKKKTLELTLVIVLAHTLMRTQVYSPKEKRITAELKSIAYMQKYRLIEFFFVHASKLENTGFYVGKYMFLDGMIQASKW